MLRVPVDFTRNRKKNPDMKDTSTEDRSADLSALIDNLTAAARRAGLNDSQWAAARPFARKHFPASADSPAAISIPCKRWHRRLERRYKQFLARRQQSATDDGHFPLRFDRDTEERLLFLCASGDLDLQHWLEYGSSFFMAGIAVMLASLRDMDRRRYLALAEALYAGSSRAEVFSLWLQRTALRPSRFVPSLRARMKSLAEAASVQSPRRRQG